MMRKSAAMVILLLIVCSSLLSAETRSVPVDFFILLDVSLSMEGAPIREAREFTAQNVIGALVEPGDWVCLVKFWGEHEVVWQEAIGSQTDKARLIRSLATVQADGRFTDIGLALDLIDTILLERGQPERPKYVLLITDEIQEARPGTPYYAEDHVLRHHMLDYVRRIDRGLYRVITVGHPQRQAIEDSARYLYDLLSNPPSRPVSLLPGAPTGTTLTGVIDPLTGQPTIAAYGETETATSAETASGMARKPASLAILLFILLPLLLLVLIVWLVLRLRKNRPVAKRKTKEESSEL
ncbi:MAG: hypothetical protein A2087_05780 [Spirochaetes bacterium GWD1_61_31]|nr:MAG: hypothetical protein A2Y37_13640 [Spirochaetes bacterium GWB1_60_80]OHD31512.1 MAG: hypothetical protein A2004_13265 [Spirochaetes bacterium GWC1_61_12]OHD43289.1 MAG: hypothetical protein A2087_05780 [Spirochaetes bacterium GWD1_61_31]OHD45621.1 MAG: hypothetical protein A2Y35_09210 [Spirochaetes bacterium GWE1_60_18]OHD60472.1 MAG: hypothetical protein A2Y32_02900 [Spirochaetes bacterium GWF1_60_12]